MVAVSIMVILPLLRRGSTTLAAGAAPDAQAAMDAVEAFYTLDYTEDPDLWATRVCIHTTDAGCRAIRGFFAPAVAAMALENHVQTTCSVTPIRLVSETGNTRIWEMAIALQNPWPGLVSPVQDAYVEVEKVNDTWLMNRILFQQEIKRYFTPTP